MQRMLCEIVIEKKQKCCIHFMWWPRMLNLAPMLINKAEKVCLPCKWNSKIGLLLVNEWWSCSEYGLAVINVMWCIDSVQCRMFLHSFSPNIMPLTAWRIINTANHRVILMIAVNHNGNHRLFQIVSSRDNGPRSKLIFDHLSIRHTHTEKSKRKWMTYLSWSIKGFYLSKNGGYPTWHY